MWTKIFFCLMTLLYLALPVEAQTEVENFHSESKTKESAVIGFENLLFVLDSSQDMKAAFDSDHSKIKIAKQLIKRIVESAPNSVHFGLRVYGNSRESSQIMKDSYLITPIRVSSRDELISALERVKPSGSPRALIWAVKKAFEQDLAAAKGGSLVVLITSGEGAIGLRNYFNTLKSKNGLSTKLVVLNLDKRISSSRITNNPNFARILSKTTSSSKELKEASSMTRGKYYSYDQVNSIVEEITTLM